MQFNEQTRRALDQRPRPLREFSVGDDVAVWRRGTGKGAPGKQRRTQWRGPGIILGAVRGNYFVAMPGSVIKAAPEQLRHGTAEEHETDRRCFATFGGLQMSYVNPVRQRTSKTSRSRIGQDGDLNPAAEGVEPSPETLENQLPSRRLMRKTPPSGVDEKHPDSQIEHVGQTPVDVTTNSGNWKQHPFFQR